MASEIKVDTISEKTSAGGVTIDGLLIKDGNISGDVALAGTTPTFTIGDAGAEDATLLFDGNAQDFHIGLDDTADDLVIGVGSTLGTTTALAIDENANTTFSGTVTVGVDDTGKDVKLFGASAGAYALWDESANLLDLRGATAAGPGHLKLTTGELTVVDADVLGKIEFQAPLETGTDAITVAASIYAEADDTFSASVNNTDLVFALGKSEAAAEKFRFTADTEIGIGGANYGTDGQVLTSGGAGAACAWEDASGAVTALNNATANELVTVGSTTTELDAESTLTFDGNALVVGGTAPSITIGDAGAEDTKLVFDGNALDFHIGLDDSADTLVIGKGSALGTTTAMSFDTNGIITKPLQPSFGANPASVQTDIVNSNTAVEIVWGTERWDVNADFASNTFTAPVTGYYSLSTVLDVTSIDTAATFYTLTIATTNRTYAYTMKPDLNSDTYWSFRMSIIADMDAGDVSTVKLAQNGGTDQTNIVATSWFMGALLQ